MTAYDQIEYATVTDVGILRSHNQDCHAVLLAGDEEQFRLRGHLFLVADGMGAHAVGELASELAASIIPHTHHKHAEDGPEAALRKSFVEANASIHTRGQQNREFQGMGTTTTVLLVRPEGAWFGHVGDSRAYRVRDGKISQLTFDHSLLWEMARRQKVDPNGLQGVPKNVIVRSLGPEPLVQVDVEGPHPLQAGDIYVLCSDGLSGQVTDYEIGAVTGVLPPGEACRSLVNLANLRGGPDNVTVVVVHVGGQGKAGANAAPVREEPARPRHRVPWPIAAILLGVLFSAGAAALTANQVRSGGLITFVLACASLITGLAGLGIHFLQDRRQPVPKGQGRTLNVYRDMPCPVSPALVDRMRKAEEILHTLATQLNWEIDWQSQKEARRSAEEFQGHNDLTAAFREYCRAVRPFAEVVQKLRLKDESISPIWERTESAEG